MSSHLKQKVHPMACYCYPIFYQWASSIVSIVMLIVQHNQDKSEDKQRVPVPVHSKHTIISAMSKEVVNEKEVITHKHNDGSPQEICQATRKTKIGEGVILTIIIYVIFYCYTVIIIIQSIR